MKKRMFLLVAVCFFFLSYWLAWSKQNIRLMEDTVVWAQYVIWTLFWLAYGGSCFFVFKTGHEMAIKHLQMEGIKCDNKHMYPLSGFFCVGGLILYCATFGYFYFGCTYWCAAVPTAYLIFLETFSHFVRASKLTRREDGDVVARRG